jgi:hypothetical protein
MIMGRFMSTIFVFIIMTGFMSALAFGDEPKSSDVFDLRYTMESGTVFKVIVTSTKLKSQDIMGKTVKTMSTDSSEIQFTVISADDNGMAMEMVFINRTHSSDDPRFLTPTDFSALLGQEVQFHLSSIGELSEFEGFEDLPEIEISDINETLNELNYKMELEKIFIIFAGRPLTIGEEWIHHFDYDIPINSGQLDLFLGYRHMIEKKINRNGIDCIHLVGSIDVRGEGQFDMSGMPLELTLNGSGEETVLFAQDSGMIMVVNSSTSISGKALNEEIGLEIPFTDKFETEIAFSF